MVSVSCNLCGADDAQLVNEGRDLLLDRPGTYRLVRCRVCDLIYQNPRLAEDEIAAHYPEAYGPYQKAAGPGAATIARLSQQHAVTRRARQLIKHRPVTGAVLDVGCSTGLFLNEMQQSGWQTRGVELSPYAAAYAREKFGLDVFNGTLEAAAFPENSFDVVSLWDVLEHVIDPRATLAEITRILKPGGMLALSLPNPASFEARLFGRYWVGWDRPRHLHLFEPPVLERYLREAGFDRIVFDSLGGRLGLTLMSVEFWWTARGYSAERWRLVRSILYAPPFRLITWPFYRLAEKANKTTSMTIFATVGKL